MFVPTIILLRITMYLTLVSVGVSSYVTFTPVVIFTNLGSDAMDLFLYFIFKGWAGLVLLVINV